MQTVLPVRRSAFNAPACSAAPAAFVVLVHRGHGPAGEIALRGEYHGDLAGARRHARVVCQAVADRFAVPAIAEVLDAIDRACGRDPRKLYDLQDCRRLDRVNAAMAAAAAGGTP